MQQLNCDFKMDRRPKHLLFLKCVLVVVFSGQTRAKCANEIDGWLSVFIYKKRNVVVCPYLRPSRAVLKFVPFLSEPPIIFEDLVCSASVVQPQSRRNYESIPRGVALWSLGLQRVLG